MKNNNNKSHQNCETSYWQLSTLMEWVREWAPGKQLGRSQHSRRRVVVVACSDYKFETSHIVGRDCDGRHDHRRDCCGAHCNWRSVSVVEKAPLHRRRLRCRPCQSIGCHVKVTRLVRLKIATYAETSFKWLRVVETRWDRWWRHFIDGIGQSTKLHKYLLIFIATTLNRKMINC